MEMFNSEKGKEWSWLIFKGATCWKTYSSSGGLELTRQLDQRCQREKCETLLGSSYGNFGIGKGERGLRAIGS